MSEMDEKTKRLAEWHETLSGTIVRGSYDAWHAELRQGVRMMKTEGLISAEEARELLELADAAHSHMIESLNDR
ncbi:hypothetical protein [Pseudomonas sp. PS02290]|uniref:hypothetical protein n=1 Tax=Pseudomonas sp. PS02290 TaxID=2991430 RepID=UPI00249A29C5|nr:hypothetical protein [Pseudomonas sp. PS02290]